MYDHTQGANERILRYMHIQAGHTYGAITCTDSPSHCVHASKLHRDDKRVYWRPQMRALSPFFSMDLWWSLYADSLVNQVSCFQPGQQVNMFTASSARSKGINIRASFAITQSLPFRIRTKGSWNISAMNGNYKTHCITLFMLKSTVVTVLYFIVHNDGKDLIQAQGFNIIL